MKKASLPILMILIAFVLYNCKTGNNENTDTFDYQPNILWIVAEDMSDHWGCYGEETIETPFIDKLASEGELFENAFVTNPVCSPSRSAMITGMYQSTIGAHNHRSQNTFGKAGGNEAFYDSYELPQEVPFLPRLFHEAGYFTVIGGEQKPGRTEGGPHELGKTDYNFVWDHRLYDSDDWSDRKPGQPFFAQIQLEGGKHREAEVENPVDPATVKLPPYYPDDEVLRKDWATYLNSIMYLDNKVQEITSRLEKEGIADSTAVFLFTDHGISHLKGKQFLYEEGINIPLIVKWPEITRAGTRRTDLISHIDIAATSLHLAGITIPDIMQGQSFYGSNYEPRSYVFSGRDRCDETVDVIRAVRTDRYKYIRNFYPHKPYAQPNRYKDGKNIMQHMRNLYHQGELKPSTARFFEPTRPVDELYDLQNDPYEMNNLAIDAAYQDTLKKMQDLLYEILYETNDLGFIPEPIAEVLGKKYDNKYFILQHPENQQLLDECIRVMTMDEQTNAGELIKALSHDKPSVRYWAAYGLGNIPDEAESAISELNSLLHDQSDAVKIAAARALCKMGKTDPGLQLLADNLDNSNILVGLYASLFLEDLNDSLAKQVLPAIQKAKENPYNFTRRVAARLSDSLTTIDFE